MTFMSIIEHTSNITLSDWNIAQKKLWLRLEELGLVHKNDYNVFLKFAAFFDNFHKEHNKFPDPKDVKKGIGL